MIYYLNVFNTLDALLHLSCQQFNISAYNQLFYLYRKKNFNIFTLKFINTYFVIDSRYLYSIA